MCVCVTENGRGEVGGTSMVITCVCACESGTYTSTTSVTCAQLLISYQIYVLSYLTQLEVRPGKLHCVCMWCMCVGGGGGWGY